MSHPQTVELKPLPGHHAVVLSCAAWINEFDIPAAFHSLKAELDAASMPLHVIVDLTQNPNLPLATTINESLEPFMHRMMGEWLVVGTNHRAEIIANTIMAVGLRKNIHWFSRLSDALIYLQMLETDEEDRRIDTFDGV